VGGRIFIAAAPIAGIIPGMPQTGSAGKARGKRDVRPQIEQVLRAIPLPVIVASRDLREVQASDAAARLLGVPAGKNLAGSGGPPPWEVLHDGERIPGERLPLTRALRGEEVEDQEIELKFPDGRRVLLAASARPIHDEHGQVLGAACTLKDLSEMARLARQIELGRRRVEEAGIVKDWRLAIAFHDIRSSLNTVNLLAEILGSQVARPEGQEDDELVKLAADMKAATASLIEIVKDTLERARSSAERPPLAESEFSVGLLLAEEGSHHLHRAREKGLHLTIEEAAPPLWIRADRLRLAHALGFLFRHSIDSTPSGAVTARAGVNAEGKPEIRVLDSGGGLPPEIERQLLDHLSRIRRDGQAQPEPGLAVLRKLVEAVGARLSLENRPGEGTTYKIATSAERITRAPARSPGDPQARTPAGEARPVAGHWWL
jgi:PAS domain S-box-containing protein